MALGVRLFAVVPEGVLDPEASPAPAKIGLALAYPVLCPSPVPVAVLYLLLFQEQKGYQDGIVPRPAQQSLKGTGARRAPGSLAATW